MFFVLKVREVQLRAVEYLLIILATSYTYFANIFYVDVSDY